MKKTLYAILIIFLLLCIICSTINTESKKINSDTPNNIWNFIYENVQYQMFKKVNGQWVFYENPIIRYINTTNGKKFSIEFHANTRTDYKFFLRLNVDVNNYSIWSINTTIKLYYESIIIKFNYSDLKSIPNLILDYGLLNNTIWFSAQRNNVPLGTYILDPFYNITNSGSVRATNYPTERKIVKCLNGTYYAVYQKLNTKLNIFIAHSDTTGSVWNEFQLTSYTSYDTTGCAIAINKSGALFVVYKYRNNTGTIHGICLKTLFNGIWTTFYIMPSNGFITYYPVVCCNNNNDVLVCCYGKFGLTTYNGIYGRLLTGGVWTSRIVIGDMQNNQEQPSITVLNNNSFVVVWDGKITGGSYQQLRCRYWYGADGWTNRRNLTTDITNTVSQNYPSVCVDTNNNLFIASYGGSNPSRIRLYTGNPVLTTVTTGGLSTHNQEMPSISCDLNNKLYISWCGISNGSTKYRFKSCNYTTNLSNIYNVSGYEINQRDTCMLYQSLPTYYDLKTNVLLSGFICIYTNGTGVTFFSSSDSSFLNIQHRNYTWNSTYLLDDTNITYRYLNHSIERYNINNFNMNTSIWINGTFLFTNRTKRNGLIQFDINNKTKYYFFISGENYNITFNTTDTIGNYVNDTYAFSYNTSLVNEDKFFLSGTLYLDSYLLSVGICLSLWLYFISKYLDNKNTPLKKGLALTQLGLSFSVVVFISSISYINSNPFGYVVSFIIPIISSYLFYDALYR